LIAVPSWHVAPDFAKIEAVINRAQAVETDSIGCECGHGHRDVPSERDSDLISQQQRQEDLSLAYLLAVVARSGMTFDPPKRDFGIDGTISPIASRRGRLIPSGVKLDIQLKSSVNATVEDQYVSYALEVRAYEILRNDDPRIGTPRILVLFLLPNDEGEWLDQDEEPLIMRKCAYWISLKGHPPTTNQKSITIRIPRKNLFGVDKLRGIMDTLNRGGMV
jgi:hypothetical protein